MKTQNELKGEYKQKKFKMGVFQIRNTANGKIYVGSSLNLEAIWNRNRMELTFGNHRNVSLQKEWKEFGEENFTFEILAEIEENAENNIDYGKEVRDLEKLYVDELQPFADKGYHVVKA